MNEDKTIISDMILPHKNPKSLDLETGQPKTHPVCLARAKFNSRANDYLCYTLGAPIKADDSPEATQE